MASSRHFPGRAPSARRILCEAGARGLARFLAIPVTRAIFGEFMARGTTEVPSLELARKAASICLENKANDVLILGLQGVTDMTDYFVIASGTSDTHVRALGEHILEDLKKDGARAHHVEGLPQGRWVLLDYVDFVVHLFHPSLRSFYQIERLWADADEVPLEAAGAAR
jgi:ribosome-associated protein